MCRYACQDFTEPFSVGRETCYREAFGKNFGLNAVVLRSMLQIMRVWPPLARPNTLPTSAAHTVAGKSQRFIAPHAHRQVMFQGISLQRHASPASPDTEPSAHLPSHHVHQNHRMRQPHCTAC